MDGQDGIAALEEMYNKSTEQRRALGEAGREHVLKNYNYDVYKKSWVELIARLCEEHGSWDTRKKYTNWELLEIV